MFFTHYGNYHAVNRDYDRIFRPNGSGDYLFLLFLSNMLVTFEGKQEIAQPGSCLLYTPDYPQEYEAEGKFQNSYLHFYSDEAFLSKYQIPVNQIFYPKNPEKISQYLKDIYYEYLGKGPYYREKSDALIRELLICISLDFLSQPLLSLETENVFTQFQKLRMDMLVNCHQDWSIKKLCSEISLEKSQFYYYYKKFFNTTPKIELLHTRIDKAKNLLTNQALQVQQVADLCGFQNIYHFTRYFKKMCGCSPSEYAKTRA